MIDAGVCEDSGKCAVALFLREQIPSAYKINVDNKIHEGVTDVWVDKRRVIFADDKKVYDFINKFDNDKSKCKPMFVEFELGEMG